MNTLMKRAGLNALGTLVYVFLVSQVMNHGEQLFGGKPNWLGGTVILLLFVVSAAITGGLVLGKPGMLYLDGQHRQAVKLFSWTLGWLVLFGIIVAIVAALL